MEPTIERYLCEFDESQLEYSSDCCQCINLLIAKENSSSFKKALCEFLVAEHKMYPTDTGRVLHNLRRVQMFQWHIIHEKTCIMALRRIIKVKVDQVLLNDEPDEPKLSKLYGWFEKFLRPFVEILFNGLFVNEVMCFVDDYFCKARVGSLFNLVSEFPDSVDAVLELRDSMIKSGRMGYVGKTFKAMLQKRLLHMGASTNQILDYYVCMIKSLRVIDGSDMLLSFVAAPVRKYLKERKDTVRCIVSSLIAGGTESSELHFELRHGGASLEYAVDEDDEELGPGEQWEPSRRNTDLREQGNTAPRPMGRIQDILSLLVSMYGSTDLFISEYRGLLADKLLSSTRLAAEQETATLELLKIRFGEESLHSCEVMLKDVEDSKRTNNAVHSKLIHISPRSNLDTEICGIENTTFSIISEYYWPSIPKDTMSCHASIDALVRAYCDAYTLLKKPRKLHPLSHSGLVELELEFDDGAVRSFVVSPLQANVIAWMGDESVTALSLLVARCGDVEEDDVLGALAFWTRKGVVRERSVVDTFGDDRHFEVVESQLLSASADRDTMDDGGDMTMRMDAVVDLQHRSSLAIVEGFVRGLLSSHGSMSLERLHSMLKLLVGSSGVADARFDMNLLELRQYLHSHLDQLGVELVDGHYCPMTK